MLSGTTASNESSYTDGQISVKSYFKENEMMIPLSILRGDRVGRKIDLRSLFGSYSIKQVAPTDE